MTLDIDMALTASLDGTWDFALGEKSPWQTIEVPGCWEAQGFPMDIDGPAHYRRQVQLPSTWDGYSIFLEFGAVSYACQVSVNGQPAGEHTGMWTPFELDVTALVQPGRWNSIEVEVYKPGGRYPLRSCLSGFLPDIACAFGGLWQPVRLAARQASLHDLLVTPDASTGRLQLSGRVFLSARLQGSPLTLQARVSRAGLLLETLELNPRQEGVLSGSLLLSFPSLWSPSHPNLYEVSLSVNSGDQVLAHASQQVGFRDLQAIGEGLSFNGSPITLRGILSWGWDPRSIAPRFTSHQVRSEIRSLKRLGFNLIKLCLFVPDQTYYRVADEEGIFLWQEWPMWLPELEGREPAEIEAEYEDYMQLASHHPSVVLYSAGCELDRAVPPDLLASLTGILRSNTQGALVCDNSGSGEAYGSLPEDLCDFYDYHPYSDIHFFVPLLDHWRRDWRPPRPWIFGEFCDCDVFRDIKQIIAANGGRAPWWLTPQAPVYAWRPEAQALVDQLQRLQQPILDRSPDHLVEIANAQALVVRKYTLEAVRSRSIGAGYVVTGLRDTPISTSGLFDDLGRSRWQPAEFLPFNQDSVLCLDSGRKRRWIHGGDRPDRLDPHNFWAGDEARFYLIASLSSPFPAGSQLFWRLSSLSGEPLEAGQLELDHDLLPGRPLEAGAVHIRFPDLQTPAQVQLQASLISKDRQVENSWNLWVYPRPGSWPDDIGLYDPGFQLEGYRSAIPGASLIAAGSIVDPPPILLAAVLDPWVIGYIENGGQLLLLPGSGGPLPARRAPFWREAIKVFHPHPVWKNFPHPGHVGLQFFGLASDVVLDSSRLGDLFPRLQTFTPLLSRLDARQFDTGYYLFETQVGSGRILACSLRLQGGLGAQPSGLARNVAGYTLLWALLSYLAGDSY